jgi:hypothetical protein
VFPNVLNDSVVSQVVTDALAFVIYHNGKSHTRQSTVGLLRQTLVDLPPNRRKKLSAEIDSLMSIVARGSVSELLLLGRSLPRFTQAQVALSHELDVSHFRSLDCSLDCSPFLNADLKAACSRNEVSIVSQCYPDCAEYGCYDTAACTDVHDDFVFDDPDHDDSDDDEASDHYDAYFDADTR